MYKIKLKLLDKFFFKKNKLSNTNSNQNLSNNNNFFLKKDLSIINKNFNNIKNNYCEQNNINDIKIFNYKKNFKIPKPISREIKSEKIKQLTLLLIGIIMLIVTSSFIILYFNKTNIKLFPHPAITIPLAIISITIILINIIEFISLRREVELYIERAIKGSILPPNFIIKNYRKIHAKLIIINWLSISSYVFLSASIGIMFLISGQKLTFIIQKWTFNIPDMIKDAKKLTIIMGIILTINMINIIIFKFRKNNIISYYGDEIINQQELNQYKKKINKICIIIIIIFISLIFFAIIIPIIILKKRNKK